MINPDLGDIEEVPVSPPLSASPGLNTILTTVNDRASAKGAALWTIEMELRLFGSEG
jgi:hypothetical protein